MCLWNPLYAHIQFQLFLLNIFINSLLTIVISSYLLPSTILFLLYIVKLHFEAFHICMKINDYYHHDFGPNLFFQYLLKCSFSITLFYTSMCFYCNSPLNILYLYCLHDDRIKDFYDKVSLRFIFQISVSLRTQVF